MKREGYRFAVAWIALNDEPAEKDVEEIAGFISTSLVADLFNKTNDQVAQDILRYRNKQGD